MDEAQNAVPSTSLGDGRHFFAKDVVVFQVVERGPVGTFQIRIGRGIIRKVVETDAEPLLTIDADDGEVVVVTGDRARRLPLPLDRMERALGED